VNAAPPPGFDPRDPTSAYDFPRIGSAVRAAASAGLTPLLVGSHAPNFAEAPHQWPYAFPGSWAPNPAAVEAFAAALARRYDGSFPDPLAPGRTLPRVALLQAWNEPNLARYLAPQWVVSGGRWSAFSPLLYRQLLNGFYAGVKSVAPNDVVISAGVAPDGDPQVSGWPQTSWGSCRARGPRLTCLHRPFTDALPFTCVGGDPNLPGGLLGPAADLRRRQGDRVAAPAVIRLHTAPPAGPKPRGHRPTGKATAGGSRRASTPACILDLTCPAPAVDRWRESGRLAVLDRSIP
jgi:hypothetical protein